MKKLLLILFGAALMMTWPVSGKKPDVKTIADEEVLRICDSIVLEGNLLYRYEKTAWLGTDIGLSNQRVSADFFNYLVYEDAGTMKMCLMNSDLESICDLVFPIDFSTQPRVIHGKRSLTEREESLFMMKNKVLNNILEKNDIYGLGVPEGFSLNFVLLPAQNGYRFYVLTGTAMHDVIPFGNDWFFATDEDGNITRWRKMHSGLLPLQTKPDGKHNVIETTHSHRHEEPFITPTDVCTFMLYGSLYGQKTFSVLSVALRRYMI